jgi:hypothetical protein
MTIAKRLKRLERSTEQSLTCICFPPNIEAYIQDLGEDASDNEPKLASDPIPDVCPKCGKQTEKKVTTIQLVDGTTKDRFPAEWQSYNGK